MKVVYFLDPKGEWRRLPSSSRSEGPLLSDFLRRLAASFESLFPTETESFLILEEGALLLRKEEDGTALILGRKNIPQVILGAQLKRALKQVQTLSLAPSRVRPSTGSARSSRSVADSGVLHSYKDALLSSNLPSASSTAPPEEAPFLSIEEVGPAEFTILDGSEEPTWEQLKDFISSALSLSGEYLGPTVAANYWRQALREADLQEIRVDFRGRVDLDAPAPRLSSGDQDRFRQALKDWQERCRRVIPEFVSLQSQLRPPHWTQLENQR